VKGRRGADADGPPVLTIRELTTSFRVHGEWKAVVRDVSFDIRARETVAVVG